jgi:hypothetical protein
LPRAAEPLEVRRKLVEYSLDWNHEVGGPKARGFWLILGITMKDADYVVSEICTAIVNTPISSVRDNHPHGVNCVVDFPLRGVGGHQQRLVRLRTIWRLADAESRPRLVGAFLKT